MTFTEAQEAARPAFAQTRAPGLDAVAHALQRAVTNEQNRLAVEVAKAEGRCTDLENKVKKLEAALTASQAREVRLRKLLERANYNVPFDKLGLSELRKEIDAALADWHKAKGE